MLNGETLTDGLFSIKPGGIGVVCPVLDIQRLVGEEVVINIWCIMFFGFLYSYFDPGPFAFALKCIDC